MKSDYKKITFVLPGFISIPMGGVKVVNRLAELLSQREYTVTLVYTMELQSGIVQKIKSIIKKYLDKKQNVKKSLYYIPGNNVNAIVVKEISEKYIPTADYIVAVGWQTANRVFGLSESKGNKYYFLQSYETYFYNYQKVRDTYKLKMDKIAISHWVQEEIEKIGSNALGPVGNSINPAEFYVEDGIQKETDVVMLYHPAKIKNAPFGLAILKNLKKRNKNFKAIMFSARQPLHKIPDWIKVIVRPDIETLRRIYNRSKIYLNTSKWEGWGLTPMEAMACGCGIVAVKNKGIVEYLKNDKNSFIINPKDKQKAIQKIEELLKNELMRNMFIMEAHKTLQKFNEQEMVSKFENCLKGNK